MNDLWQTDDAEWLRNRKAEWKKIKLVLDEMNLRIRKKDHKFHKEYFLYGRKDPTLGSLGEKPFDCAFPLFELWYAPEIDENTIQAIYDKQLHPHSLNKSRELLFNIGLGRFDSKYGMMGGREKYAVKMLYPGLDWKKKFFLSKEDKEGFTYSTHPEILIQDCVNKSSGLLQSGRVNPFHPGQYLWEHLNYAFDNYFELITKFNIHGVSHILRNVIDFDERENAPRSFQHSVAFKETLEAGFLERKFCPNLMSLWDKVLKDYRNGEGPPVWRKR